MSFFVNITDPIREFFTLRRAERAIRAYTPAQHERVRACVETAERRLLAGRRQVDASAAAVLLRDAVSQYLLAMEAARTEPADMPPLPPDPADPRAQPSDDARVRAALASKDPAYFDGLSSADTERTRWALDRAAAMLRPQVEARSATNLRGARWGRLAALVFVVVYAALLVVRAAVVPPNIALGKPVHPSSRKPGTPNGHELVDGAIGTSYALATNTEDNANVVIDLLATYRIDRVAVFNRVDGWFGDSLPLVVELSADGKDYHELGRRETYFGTDPPWTVEGHGMAARYVRVRATRHTYLALSEIQVFGKK